MKGEELLNVLGDIDPKLIQDADRRPGWIRWAAVAAACLAVLLTVLLFPRKAQPEDPLVQSQPTTAPSQDWVPIVDSLNAPVVLGDVWDTGIESLGGAAEAPPMFSFDIHIVVEARVVGCLPERYLDMDTGSAFHILQLEVLDVVTGKNVPQMLNLRLEGYLSPELQQFDRLVLSIEQVGLEDYLMIRETDRVVVPFNMMFRVYSHCGRPSYGSVLAFHDGVLDRGLWDLDRWGVSDRYLDYLFGSDGYYLASGCNTVEEVKEAVREEISQMQWFREYPVGHKADYSAVDAMEYTAPFQNGVFSHSLIHGVPGELPVVFFNRKINGYRSAEQIRIDQEGATYSGEKYTMEELEQIPDLAGLVQGLKKEQSDAPHIEDFEGLELWSRSVAGRYYKVNGQVYGVVKIHWVYLQDGGENITYAWRDDQFYLVEEDGSYGLALREELKDLLGHEESFLLGVDGVAEELPLE